jgi:hypothetical protein
VFSASSLSLTLLPFRRCACRSAGLSIRPLLALASVLAAALSLLICRVPGRGGVSGGLFKLPASVSTLSLPGRGVGRLALRLARVGLLSLISAVVSATAGWSGIFRARCRRAWSCCFRASPAWTGLQLLARSIWVPAFTTLATPGGVVIRGCWRRGPGWRYAGPGRCVLLILILAFITLTARCSGVGLPGR